MENKLEKLKITNHNEEIKEFSKLTKKVGGRICSYPCQHLNHPQELNSLIICLFSNDILPFRNLLEMTNFMSQLISVLQFVIILHVNGL